MWKKFELTGLACLGCNTDLLLPLISDVQAQTEVYTISSLTLKSLNYINSFPGHPACRWPIVGLLSVHNCMSQYLIINLSLFIYVPTHTHTQTHTQKRKLQYINQNFNLYNFMLPLLLLSRFSHVRLCETPQTAAYQAPPSLGFSRQERWSGLPFPSPMYESEKWKRSCSVLSDSSRPHGLQPTRLLCPWDFPGKSTGVGCHCLLQIFFYVTYI